MQKTFLFLLLMVFMCSFAGCANEKLINESLNDTETSMEMSYDKFSGKRSKTVTLKANMKIKIEISTINGEIALSIVDKAGNKAFTSRSLTAGSFNVTINKDSDYTIKIVAKSHEGSYKIMWE